MTIPFLYYVILILVSLLVMAWMIKNSMLRKIMQMIVYIFFIGGWIYWVSMLIYWHTFVETSLDGSEGAGAGFGFLYVHFTIPLIALSSTIYALIMDAILEAVYTKMAQNTN